MFPTITDSHLSLYLFLCSSFSAGKALCFLGFEIGGVCARIHVCLCDTNRPALCSTSCNLRESLPHTVFQIHVLLLFHLFRLSRKLLLIFKTAGETCGVSHWGFVVVSNGDACGETRSSDESLLVTWRVPHPDD